MSKKAPFSTIEDAYDEIDRLYASLGTVDKLRLRFKEKHGKLYSKSRSSVTKLNKVSNRIKKTLRKRSANIAKHDAETPIDTILMPTPTKRINLVFERAEEAEKLKKETKGLIENIVDYCAENNASIRIIARDRGVDPSTFLGLLAAPEKTTFDFYTDSPLRASLAVRKLEITRGDIFIADTKKTFSALSKMPIPSETIFSRDELDDEYRASKHFKEIDEDISVNQLSKLFHE